MGLKMFVFFVILPVLITAFSLLSDNLAEELEEYLAALYKITDLEALAIMRFESIVAINKCRSDAQLYAILQNTVIPTYEKFSVALEKVTSANQEITTLHEKYVKGVKLNYDAMKKLLLAMERQDLDLVKEAYEDFEQATSIIDEYNKSIAALEKKAGEQ